MMYVIFITDDSAYPYRAKDANGKTLTFATMLAAEDEAKRIRQSARVVTATDVIYEGKRKRKA